MKILIIGSGDIGTAVGEELYKQGHKVVALRRSLVKSDNGISYIYIQADISDAKSVEKLDTDYDFILFIAAVDSRTEEAYKNLYEIGLGNVLKFFAQKNNEAHFIFVSSTAVYGQSNGEFIDEETLPLASTFRSKILLEAERNILAHNESSIVIRFSGIYGRGDRYMIEKIQNSQPIQYTPSYYTNRIHRDDCIGTLVFLIGKSNFNELAHRVFNATQGEAISLYDYALIIAAKYNLQEPVKEILNSKKDVGGKRISSSRVKELGYKFEHSY